MEKTKVCAYARVSTDSIDQLNSYENQVYYFNNEIGRRNDLELIRVFKDRGESATKFRTREGLMELLELCGISCDKNDNFVIKNRLTEPPFKYIYFKNTSRLGRNSKTFELVALLREQGVYCIFIEQNINTENITNDVILQILSALDRGDSVDKSIKVSTGIRVGATRGVVHANSRLYGYKYIKDDNRLEVIAEEAEVIRLIYRMYFEGLGIRRIINQLRDLDIKTRNGKEFCKSSIDRILENEKYYGANVRMKYKRPQLFSNSSTIKITEKESWIVHDNCEKIEPIISKELFNRCNEIRDKRREGNNQVGFYYGTSIFATKVKCGKCGQAYHSDVDRGKRFYRCATKKKYGVCRCDSKNISENKLLEYMNEDKYKYYLQGLKLVRIRQLRSETRKLEELIDKDSKEATEEKIKELKELEERRDRILYLFEISRVSGEEMNIKLDNVEGLIRETKNTITSLSASNEELIERIDIGRKRIEEIRNIVVNDTYIIEEILEDVEEIEVDAEGNPKVYWRFDKEL